MNCLRCNQEMVFRGTQKIQLGKENLLTMLIDTDLQYFLSGALEVGIYVCPKCHKLEFYQVGDMKDEDMLPQKKCPKCENFHDFDYPKCPICNYEY